MIILCQISDHISKERTSLIRLLCLGSYSWLPLVLFFFLFSFFFSRLLFVRIVFGDALPRCMKYALNATRCMSLLLQESFQIRRQCPSWDCIHSLDHAWPTLRRQMTPRKQYNMRCIPAKWSPGTSKCMRSDTIRQKRTSCPVWTRPRKHWIWQAFKWDSLAHVPHCICSYLLACMWKNNSALRHGIWCAMVHSIAS
jgi:hypothetical protein